VSTPIDIVVACCRDEADIIDAFIDFYLDLGFDWVCLIDNGSEDATVARVRQHARAPQVRLHHDPRPGYDARLLEYARMFEGLASRWMFFLDVDEFVPIPRGVKAFASELPAEVTVLELATAEMIPEAQSGPLETTRRENPFRDEIKVVWKSGVATKVYCGKHTIDATPSVRWRDERLLIRHFHTRSEAQFWRKLRNRLETDAAVAAVPGAADDLSAFSREERDRWIAESRASLDAGGWARELARLDGLPWAEDASIRDWHRARYAAPNTASPMPTRES
jgi:hypothetical protein